MKIITTIAICSIFAIAAKAQTVKEADVPAAVKEAFKSSHPTAKVKKWEKEGENFEAEFQVNKMETSLLYDAT